MSFRKSLLSLGVILLSAEFASAAHLYLVEPMACNGQLVSVNSTMYQSYRTQKLTLTSFLTTRREGSLANALEIQSSLSSTYYTAPLMIEGRSVKANLGVETLELTVVSSKANGGARVDLLKGTLTNPNSVVGKTIYAFNCRANIV